jgi:hypothetical protein
MSPLPTKGRKSFIDRYVTRSVAYEVITWLIFWGLYTLWAGYSPSYPKSTHSEPLFPLVVLAFMAAFFFIIGDRHEIKLLIANSAIALTLIPGLLVLNIYRALTKQFPESWAMAGFFHSQYTFFFIQCIFLFLLILLLRYTRERWKTAELAFRKRCYFAFSAIGALLLFLSALVAFFLFAGRTMS